MDLSPQDLEGVAEPAANLINFPGYDSGMSGVLRRLEARGAESLEDVELLALQLTNTCRDDEQQVAQRLLSHFGSLAQVLGASELALDHYAGPAVASAIVAAREMQRRVMLEPVAKRPVMGNWKAVQTFLRHEMARSEIEMFAVLWLDTKMNLIQYEVLATGDIDFAPVRSRQFVKRAIERNASSCIIAHCHPSRSTEPSRSDIEMTKKLTGGLALVDIKLIDHLIVAGDQVVSMASLGLLS